MMPLKLPQNRHVITRRQSNCFVIILPGDFNVKCYKIYIKLTDLLFKLYKFIPCT